MKLIEKIESIVKQMRWRAHFFLQAKHESDIRREDFEFKSKITPQQCEHMEAFEKELLDIIPNMKFQSVKDVLQKKLKEEIPKKNSHQTFLSSQTKQVISMKCPNSNIKSFFIITSPKHTKKHHPNWKRQ